MPDRFASLDALIRDVEGEAAGRIDPLAILGLLIKLCIESEADPYLLMGELVEGIAVTVARRVPAEKQSEVSIETMRMLRDRLRAYGFV